MGVTANRYRFSLWGGGDGGKVIKLDCGIVQFSEYIKNH